MSKSTNGANITAEDILRMNPDLLGQVGQAPPQSIPEPMPEPASMTTDQAIANFYGSGDRITQPDMAYYDEFPLPGDTGRAPAPELPQPRRNFASVLPQLCTSCAAALPQRRRSVAAAVPQRCLSFSAASRSFAQPPP